MNFGGTGGLDEQKKEKLIAAINNK